MKKLLKMQHDKARLFFLKPESYSTIDLPLYYNFDKVIKYIDKKIYGKDYKTFYCPNDRPGNYNDVNYKIYKNKNGKYAWRPLELINPFLYVAMVNLITEKDNWKIIVERFEEFSKNKNIVCCSIPNESSGKESDKKTNIKNWITSVEQETIKLAIDYKYMAITDITNCYSSIYTHTIPWSLYGEDYAKQNRNDKSLLGNKIDSIFQDMNYSQTNGIPQGSVLTDFMAELILGYADYLLGKRLETLDVTEYKIIRFRDDYRIFANDEKIISIILKELTEILLNLNLKLNEKKTKITSDIISNSMKTDKYEYLNVENNTSFPLEKQLLIIKQIGDRFPNSSKQKVMLSNLYNDSLKDLKKSPKNYSQLISILVDIAFNNPDNLNVCIVLINKLSMNLSKNAKIDLIDRVQKKFNEIPNTEFLNIWLQRIIITAKKDYAFEDKICCKVVDPSIKIWNTSWLNFDIKEDQIIDIKERDSITKEIPLEEADRFNIY